MFHAKYGGVIRVSDAIDSLKAKTEADKLQIQARAPRQVYIAQQRAKIERTVYIYHFDEYIAENYNCTKIKVLY